MSLAERAPEPSHSSQICLRGIVICRTKRMLRQRLAQLQGSTAYRGSGRAAPPSPPSRPTHRHLVPLVNTLQLNLHIRHHILPPPLLLLSMVSPAKRVPEHVERVVEPPAAALLLALEALLAKAVVRLALLGVREDVVRGRDVEEALLGRFGLVLRDKERSEVSGGRLRRSLRWVAGRGTDLVGVVRFTQFLQAR